MHMKCKFHAINVIIFFRPYGRQLSVSDPCSLNRIRIAVVVCNYLNAIQYTMFMCYIWSSDIWCCCCAVDRCVKWSFVLYCFYTALSLSLAGIRGDSQGVYHIIIISSCTKNDRIGIVANVNLVYMHDQHALSVF